MKENMMPGPKKLDEIQKTNLTDEQIEKDNIREEAYNAGTEKGKEQLLSEEERDMKKIRGELAKAAKGAQEFQRAKEIKEAKKREMMTDEQKEEERQIKNLLSEKLKKGQEYYIELESRIEQERKDKAAGMVTIGAPKKDPSWKVLGVNDYSISVIACGYSSKTDNMQPFEDKIPFQDINSISEIKVEYIGGGLHSLGKRVESKGVEVFSRDKKS